MKNFQLIITMSLFLQLNAFAQLESLSDKEMNIFSVNSVNAVNVNIDSLMLDSIIVAYKNTNQIPGLATMIIKDDKVIWSKNYGYRNSEQQLPVEDSTIFLLSSASKLFVATAVMQLWENGIIDMDKNINSYLPNGFTVTNPYYPNDSITVKTLLNHTSSIQDNMTLLWSLNRCGDSPIPLNSFVVDYLRPEGKYYKQSNFYNYHPGQTYNYSNIGVCLLAVIIENLTGKTFDEYCNENIFKPLSMNSTSWFLDGMNTNNIAIPYDGYGPYYPICNQGSPYYPSVTLRSNKIDLSHFLCAYINNGVYNNQRILDSATIIRIFSDQLGYNLFGGAVAQGLIWFRLLIYNGSVWGHNGDWFGAETFIGLDPVEKYGIVWLQNSSESGTIYTRLWGINYDFTRYAYSYGHIYALGPSIDKFFARVNTDSVLFRTTFSNIYNRSFTPHLIYINSDSTAIDSLTLFDDGLHNDLLSDDGVYGGYIPPQTNEDFCSLGVSTIDNENGKYFSTPDICRFTTITVRIDSLSINKSPTRLTNLYDVKSFLRNESKSATIKNASVKLISNDPWIKSILLLSDNLSDINPGTTVGSSIFRVQYIDSLFPGYFDFKAEILSDDWTYWTDSKRVPIPAVGIEAQANQPLIFNLEQNYPNPFNPTTYIKFSIASRQCVELKIFNVLGQEIQTLINAEKSAGNYQVEFNAVNLPSGVYFYKIQAGDFVETKKMILLK